MNAPATPAAVRAAAKFQIVPATDLKPSKSHVQELRRQRYSKESLDQLSANIKQVGVAQPILLRPLGSGLEIVAGERRWRAALQAGLLQVPAMVQELTDDQALELQLIENLQREDLHELEEAEGYEELMKLKKVKVDDLVGMVGKSRSTIYARTKLLALCPEARKAFYAGELDASRALLVARIGHHDTQRKALLDVTKGAERWGGRRDDGPMSFREAHRHLLDRYMLKLKQAPFDPQDATLLPKAGSCATCPKRTGNQKDLFNDVKDPDVCTDPKCFDDKRQVHYGVARRKLENAGKTVIFGAEAKKLLPHWENGSDSVAGTHIKVSDSDYIAGKFRKVADVLGRDYQPLLVQHPLNGKILEIAPKSTVSSKGAALDRERARSRTGGESSSAKAAATRNENEKKEASLQEAIKREILAAAHAQTVKPAAHKAAYRLIARILWGDTQNMVAQQTYRALGALHSFKKIPGWGSYPAELDKLSPVKAISFALDCLVAMALDDRDLVGVLKVIKLDPKAIEKRVRDEAAVEDTNAKAAKVNAQIEKRAAKTKTKKKGRK